MTDVAIEQYAYVLKRAFDESEHSFVRNLQSTSPEHWTAIVAGQPFGRSIGYIAWHTVAAKHLYWDHAFGDRKLTGNYTGLGLTGRHRTLPEVIAYGRKWHEAWLHSLDPLTADDLESPTTAHWGEVVPMRRVIAAMIEHDLYHAGEINHLRAQLERNDGPPGG
ncbi:MAG: DinB family protein [Dehalococcoidia bacterium]